MQANEADHEMLALEDIPTNFDDSISKSENVQKWMQLSAETSELTQNLTEQLRLILEATKATREALTERGLHLAIVDEARDLGIDTSAGRRRAVKLAKKRKLQIPVPLKEIVLHLIFRA